MILFFFDDGMRANQKILQPIYFADSKDVERLCRGEMIRTSDPHVLTWCANRAALRPEKTVRI